MPAAPVVSTRRLHLDKRAKMLNTVANSKGDDEELLTPKQIAAWFGVSKVWLENGRRLGFGPPFHKQGRVVFYKRGSVRAWLRVREKFPDGLGAIVEAAEKAAAEKAAAETEAA